MYSCFNVLIIIFPYITVVIFASVIINEISLCFTLFILSLLIFSTSIHSWIGKLFPLFLDCVKCWVDNIKVTYSLKLWNNILIKPLGLGYSLEIFFVLHFLLLFKSVLPEKKSWKIIYYIEIFKYISVVLKYSIIYFEFSIYVLFYVSFSVLHICVLSLLFLGFTCWCFFYLSLSSHSLVRIHFLDLFVNSAAFNYTNYLILLLHLLSLPFLFSLYFFFSLLSDTL